MARKSRKKQLVPTEIKEKEDTILKSPTAVYARLSAEKSTTESIENQVLLIEQFVENHDELQLVDTYMDNGFSGTNFDRPEFSRMMQDINQGRIQCIVVKDLSRFGRDFLDTANYIENIFPKLNVRFISVNDHFDSFNKDDMDSLSVPIKNLVNALYAKDISKKISASKAMHQKKGDVTIGRNVFGYRIDKESNKYVADKDTAPYVRLMFRWAVNGYTTGQIADKLNALGIITPRNYSQAVDRNGKSIDGDKWSYIRVRKIIENPIYKGEMCYGRTKQALYMNQPVQYVPKAEWIVHKNMHEPLVMDDDFEKAFEMRHTRTKSHSSASYYYVPASQISEEDCFNKLVFCKECGRRMYFHRFGSFSAARKGAAYRCINQNKSKSPGSCQSIVHVDYLRAVVTEQIDTLIKVMCDTEKTIGMIKRETLNDNTLLRLKKELRELILNQQTLTEENSQLYIEMAEGNVSVEDFISSKEKYNNQLVTISEEIITVKSKIDGYESAINAYYEKFNSIKPFFAMESSLVPELIKQLISEIWINQDGSIEIKFTTEDLFRRVIPLLRGDEKNDGCTIPTIING